MAERMVDKRVLNRLRRAQGQLAGLIAAVEDGRDCRAVLTQLGAVSAALDRAGLALYADALLHCLSESDPDGPSVEELERAFLSLG